LALSVSLMCLTGHTEGAWIKTIYHQTYANGIAPTFILHFKMKHKMVYKRCYDECSINKLTRSWNEMRSSYRVMCISLLHCAIITFNHILLAVWCISHISAWVDKFWNGTNQSLAAATIHKQLFPVPHYCATDRLQSVASAAQMICWKVWLLSMTLPPHIKQSCYRPGVAQRVPGS
jgi:hypothetical protein